MTKLSEHDQAIVDLAILHPDIPNIWRSDLIAALTASAERECVNCPYIERDDKSAELTTPWDEAYGEGYRDAITHEQQLRPDPDELKRLIEALEKEARHGSSQYLDRARAALYRALGIET